MKTQTIIYGVGAFAAAGLLVMLGKRQSGAGGLMTGDQQRVGGVAQWYGNTSGTAAGLQQAINASWSSMDTLFKSQPDFYI